LLVYYFYNIHKGSEWYESLQPNRSFQNLKPYVLNYDKTDNHLNIQVDKIPSNNYFMVIGDWGGAAVGHTENQGAVAAMMKQYYEDNAKLGKKLLFVLTCGDNFYYHGQTGKLWGKVWYDMYDKVLTDVPWFAVMGNHDWGNSDSYCLCPEASKHAVKINGQPYQCNQLNDDKGGVKRPSYTKNYYFPDFCYHYSINELNFELIAVSADYIDSPNGIGGNGVSKGKGAYQTNKNCEAAGLDLTSKLKTIYEAGINLLEERGKVSKNKNIIITNHYPSDKFHKKHTPDHTGLSDYFKKASKMGNKQTVIYAGGHYHSVGCKGMKGKACVYMMSGGGGGCCSKTPVKNASGFFAVHFDNNKDMITKQVSYPYHVSAANNFENSVPESIPHDSPDDIENQNRFEREEKNSKHQFKEMNTHAGYNDEDSILSQADNFYSNANDMYHRHDAKSWNPYNNCEDCPHHLQHHHDVMQDLRNFF
jgi:hypothetical protein